MAGRLPGFADGDAARVMKQPLKQCRTCPWRVGCVPERDIPRYDRRLAENLACTIRSGMETLAGGPRHAMARHHSEPGNERYCAGWLANQLGAGNNFGLRLQVLLGRVPSPEIDGSQHERYEDTLSRAGAQRARGKRPR